MLTNASNMTGDRGFIRIYDPDRHIIEIGEALEYVARDIKAWKECKSSGRKNTAAYKPGGTIARKIGVYKKETLDYLIIMRIVFSSTTIQICQTIDHFESILTVKVIYLI